MLTKLLRYEFKSTGRVVLPIAAGVLVLNIFTNILSRFVQNTSDMLPSGDFVIDIDHLASVEEAMMWRDRLFADEVLQPDLAFVSPGAKGVKLFVPYRLNLTDTLEHSFDNALHTAWDYLEWRHGLKADTANADMSRACFLAYDEEAKCKI